MSGPVMVTVQGYVGPFPSLSLSVARTDRPFTPEPSFSVPPETWSVYPPPTFEGVELLLPPPQAARLRSKMTEDRRERREERTRGNGESGKRGIGEKDLKALKTDERREVKEQRAESMEKSREKKDEGGLANAESCVLEFIKPP